MREVDDGKKEKKREGKKRISLLVATHCQQSTARTKTAGMPHARANGMENNDVYSGH